jgi:PilZ domain
MKDRRFDARLRRSFAINLRWQDSAGHSHESGVQLTDFSPSGAAVRASSPIPVGSLVTFSYENQKLSGKVRHCEKVSNAFLLGLEFDTDQTAG